MSIPIIECFVILEIVFNSAIEMNIFSIGEITLINYVSKGEMTQTLYAHTNKRKKIM
jgi:hypothetical protein